MPASPFALRPDLPLAIVCVRIHQRVTRRRSRTSGHVVGEGLGGSIPPHRITSSERLRMKHLLEAPGRIGSRHVRFHTPATPLGAAGMG